MIKKVDGGYAVFDKQGKKRLSKAYEAKEDAQKRLDQIESFKGNVVQITNAVDTTKIRRERDDAGDEIIIIPSYTLPFGVVMNGGLYPKDEIEKSYQSLEGKPAPISHPVDNQGNFVSASSEIGVNRFHAGVFNGLVEIRGERVYVEKRVNVRVAKQSAKGRALLDRLIDILDGNSFEPIHTSTGIYLEPVYLVEPRVSDSGKEYEWIATNMHFDHDAILLDEEGAATPLDGVGMMVNYKGVECGALHVNMSMDDEEFDDGFMVKLSKAVKKILSSLADEEKPSGHGGREDNPQDEEDDMSLKKLAELLKANGLDVAEDASPEDFAKAIDAKITATNGDKGEVEVSEVVANAVANAIKPLTDEINALKSQANAKEEAERTALADTLKANGFEDADIEGMTVNAMQKMAAKFNEQGAFHVNASFAGNGQEEAQDVLPD